jgi:hypothetical protein
LALLLGLDRAGEPGSVERPHEEGQTLVLGAAGHEQRLDVPFGIHPGTGFEIAEGIGPQGSLLLVEWAGGQPLDVDAHDEARIGGQDQAFGRYRTNGRASGIEIEGADARGHAEPDHHHGSENNETATRHKRTSELPSSALPVTTILLPY